ncbi:MAG: cyclase family protein [Bdellovibrionota bacterium]
MTDKSAVKLKEGIAYYDISPEITENTAVFPGDVAYSRRVSLDFEKGDALLLSSVESTLHLGAHVDSPGHYNRAGAGIEARNLNYYMGPCQVITVDLPRGERVYPKDISSQAIETQRVLFRTRSFPNPNSWNGDFNSLSAQLVDDLASKGVVLVGIDTPSIDPAEDKALEAHQAVYKNNLAVLEGIVLDAVPDGVYKLIALPLRLKGADASPVRAILCKE